MTEVTKTEAVYKTGQSFALRLHIFRGTAAAAPGAASPVLVIFHGGGWVAGRPEQFFPHARHFAQKGFVVVCPEYRVRNEHGATPFEGMADARSAIRWTRKHAQELRIDPGRLIAAGGSAGGHLALCTAVFPQYDEDPETPVSCIPDGLILFNPVVDTTAHGFGEERFAGRSPEASPVHHIRPGLPDTLVLHGTDDTTVPIENARRFVTEMTRRGNRCLLIEYPRQIHGFFNYRDGENPLFTATLDKAVTFATDLTCGTTRLTESLPDEL